MELLKSYVERSPEAGRVRLVGEVRYDGAGLSPELYWYDVPEGLAGSLTSSGNPWLACLLPLAVTLGEPLRIRRPVDAVLFENAHKLMEIWKCWYPNLHRVRIEAEVAETRPRSGPGKTAAFFSGGVDSFFTALRHREPSDDPLGFVIDELLNVWGLDIPLRNPEAYLRMRKTLQKAADELGKAFVPLATNLRETRLDTTPWKPLYHAAAIASVALALEERYGTALIASAYGYFDLRPCGSHPLTDPLFSTSRTRIVHDGSESDRQSKIRLVSESEVAMRHLHVCIRGTDDNCANCQKCYRTMTALAALGALDRCQTLRTKNFSIERVSKIYSHDDVDRTSVKQLRRFAAELGRPDIADALDRSLKHSDRMDRFSRIAKWLQTKPLIGRLAGRGLTTLITRDSIG